jgi:hypothetical protein
VLQEVFIKHLRVLVLRILEGTYAFGVMSDAEVFAIARSRPHVDCIVGRAIAWQADGRNSARNP